MSGAANEFNPPNNEEHDKSLDEGRSVNKESSTPSSKPPPRKLPGNNSNDF
jgi:hypothetical protein